jgi:Flp pilus assembly protein TadG
MKHNEKGVATVFGLLAITLFLVGMAVLAIDLGVAYTSRTQAQTAADAAALAGAEAFKSDIENGYAESIVEGAARAIAKQNIVAGELLVDNEIAVSSNVVAKRVEVIVTHKSPVIFGKGVGISDATIKARATAEVFEQDEEPARVRLVQNN